LEARQIQGTIATIKGINIRAIEGIYHWVIDGIQDMIRHHRATSRHVIAEKVKKAAFITFPP